MPACLQTIDPYAGSCDSEIAVVAGDMEDLGDDSEESLRILLLEDDSCMAALLSQGLRAGFALLNIVTARTIAEAQVLIAEFRFDLFIMDIVLPDGSGIDFLCDLLTTQSDVTTVLMTSSPTLELRRKAADLGVRHFLTKPFKPETLFNIIWHTLASEQRSEQAGETFFSGALTRLTVLDIIQLKCLNGATQAIEFVGGEKHGRVYVNRGELVHAETATAEGVEALGEILKWRGGWVAEVPEYAEPAQTIFGHWQTMLLEAAHQTDFSKEP